jgi:hypothetical protein
MNRPDPNNVEEWYAYKRNEQLIEHRATEALREQVEGPAKRRAFHRHVAIEVCSSAMAIYCILVYCHIIK